MAACRVPAAPTYSAEMPPAFRNAHVVDARTGRRMRLVYPDGDLDWPSLLGHRAAETWSRFRPVHAGKGTEVWRGTIEDGGPAYFFKTFALRGPEDRWKDVFRAPRAVRAWRRAWAVAERGFRTIPPVCLMTGRRWALDPRDLLVTREAPGLALREWFRQTGDRPARRRVLAALGREVARWHAAGFGHADLNPDNLLLAWEQGAPVFIWLDLEGTRQFRFGIRASRRAKELSDLNNEPRAFTLRERLLFWRAYRRAAELRRGEAVRVRDEALARTRRRWRKRGWLQ